MVPRPPCLRPGAQTYWDGFSQEMVFTEAIDTPYQTSEIPYNHFRHSILGKVVLGAETRPPFGNVPDICICGENLPHAVYFSHVCWWSWNHSL